MASTFDEVVKVLTPGLGESMARASVDMHLKKVGLDREHLRPKHLPALAQALHPGLAVFVGKATADALAESLRALAGPDGGS